MNSIDIAKVAHEVNREYCRALGDESQYAVEIYNAPKQVASAVSSMW